MAEVQVTTVLIKRCLGGDGSAWEEIVRAYNRRIYNLCYRFTGSATDAEDLTQEVFIKIYRTLGSYDVERGAFPTWLTTVTRNLLVDHYRKRRLERASDSLEGSLTGEEDGLTLGETLEDPGQSPEAAFGTEETRRLVHQALQKISPDLREALILRDLQDLDYKEIARVLNVPEGTVKSRINRGRTELARVISRTRRQVS